MVWSVSCIFHGLGRLDLPRWPTCGQSSRRRWRRRYLTMWNSPTLPKFNSDQRLDTSCSTSSPSFHLRLRVPPLIDTWCNCSLWELELNFQDGMNETAMAAFKYTYGPWALESLGKQHVLWPMGQWWWWWWIDGVDCLWPLRCPCIWCRCASLTCRTQL